jgi:hypothetical protein
MLLRAIRLSFSANRPVGMADCRARIDRWLAFGLVDGPSALQTGESPPVTI